MLQAVVASQKTELQLIQERHRAGVRNLQQKIEDDRQKVEAINKLNANYMKGYVCRSSRLSRHHNICGQQFMVVSFIPFCSHTNIDLSNLCDCQTEVSVAKFQCVPIEDFLSM